MIPLATLFPSSFKGYLRLGVGLVFLATVVTATLFYYKNRALTAERNALTEKVAAKEAEIAQLVQARQHDAERVQQLMNDIRLINEKDRQDKKTISNLEKTDATVREYLRSPVPDALQRVLADEGGDEADPPSARPSGAVSPTKAAGAKNKR